MPAPKIVFTSRAFRVEEVPATATDGKPRTYQVVRHPGAAAIVPWLPDGRLLLIRQPRIAVGRPLLEIPAGTLDPKETATVCAARELAEETGYTARSLRPLTRFWPSPGILDEVMWLFEARDLVAGEAHPEADEQITLRPTAPAEVAGLIRSGEIQDAKTLVGLALVGVPIAGLTF